MALRHRIYDEVQAGRLPTSWTTSDLLGNSQLTKEFKPTTLRTEPPNCSRSAEGLALNDGENSDDYFYYVRVGRRVDHGRRTFLFQLRPEAIDYPALTVSMRNSTVLTRTGRVRDMIEMPHKSAKSKPAARPFNAKAVLDELLKIAAPMVIAMKKRIADGTARNEDAWYQASYGAFAKRGNPKTLEDFICVIGFAYSWLPTNRVAACPTKVQFNELRSALKRAKSDENDKNRRGLIESGQAAVGVSQSAVITVSKVLHFWDSALAPMFDINVKRALNKLGVQPAANWDEPDGAVTNYLWYWSIADQLIQASKSQPSEKLDYRKLDELMFQMGRIKESDGDGDSGARSPRPKPHRPSASISLTSLKPNKRALAEAIYIAHRGKPRNVIIAMFVEEAGLTTGGASTYYQSCRAKFGAAD